MTRELASSILQRLQVYYPRVYSSSWSDDKCALFVDDFIESFADYKDDYVVRAFKTWHNEQSSAPTVADILNQLKYNSNARLVPFREKQYEIYIGADGNEYAREIK